MTIKEKVVRIIGELNESELQKVAEYLAFLKYQTNFYEISAPDQCHLASLYREFAENDRLEAEEGMDEYAHGLSQAC